MKSIIFDIMQGNLHYLTSKIPTSFLPYSIETTKDGNTAKITLAVAGYPKDSLDVVMAGKELKISGKKPTTKNDWLSIYSGVAFRNFNFSIPLASIWTKDMPEVSLKDGILQIVFTKSLEDTPKSLEIKDL